MVLIFKAMGFNYFIIHLTTSLYFTFFKFATVPLTVVFFYCCCCFYCGMCEFTGKKVLLFTVSRGELVYIPRSSNIVTKTFCYGFMNILTNFFLFYRVVALKSSKE